MSANPVAMLHHRGSAAADAPQGLPNPLDPSRRIRAVLFDLDGTLYRQTPVRSLMALELLTMPFSGWLEAPRRWLALRAYRRAQEQLRAVDGRSAAAAQVAAASRRSGLTAGEVERLVGEWMIARPLKYLRLSRRKGLEPLLDLLDRSGVRAGVLSDYPPELKLRALGVHGRFSPVLCTSAPEVAALKPSPRGFLLACRSWHLAPGEVLFVGDRPDVDAAGASAAGMPCVIIGGGFRSSRRTPGYLVLRSLERLLDVLDNRR